MVTPIRIKRTDSVSDIESILARLYAASDKNAGQSLHVPLAIGPHFFKESWLVGVLATANQLGVAIEKPKLESQDKSYYSLVAFAQNLYGQFAPSKREIEAENRTHAFLTSLIADGGVLTTHDSGRALTICAVDPVLQIPFAIGVTETPTDFANRFGRLRRNKFEVGGATGFSSKHPDSSRGLDNFIYEIFQNTFFHGRFASDNTLLSGIRYIHARRHIGNNRKDFLNRASGFPELSRYIESTISSDTTHTLLEISIGDRGIGLVERLLATRNDLKEDLINQSHKTRLGALNHIIRSKLSSRTNSPGSGEGLTNALSAVARLHGFVSVRSGAEWAYRDFSATSATDNTSAPLFAVSDSEHLSPISGTHFNVLIPVGHP